jgi:hypothetical protein
MLTTSGARLLAIAAICCIAVVNGVAQSTSSPFDGYTPGQAMPGAPAGAYAVSGFDTVNPASGLVSINLPLLTVQGRGTAAVPVLLPLSGPIWDATAYQYASNCNQYGCQFGYGYIVSTAGWNPLPYRFGCGRMVFRTSGDYCLGSPGSQYWNSMLTRATFVAPDGTETEFVDTNSGGVAKPGNAAYNRGTWFVSDNGTLAYFNSSSAIVDSTSCGASTASANGTLRLRDGTLYTITNGYVTAVADRNGNTTSISASAITDPTGRTYSITTGTDSGSGRNYTQIQYAGAGGANRTITIWYSSLDQVLAPGESIQTFGALWP